ncbi:MAG TPA: twin-arginine translocase TatA/TatE family subunit [Pyrinomonadaceae bacterium]|jgi:sec-independent protein translocase protein TatA
MLGIGGLGMQELIIILVILLLLFGSTRLPQLAKGMGKSIREFKKGIGEGEDDAELEATRQRERLHTADRSSLSDEELAADKATLNKPR